MGDRSEKPGIRRAFGLYSRTPIRRRYEGKYGTSDCTYGFHVYNAGAQVGDRCLCREFKLSIMNRGFVKAR